MKAQSIDRGRAFKNLRNGWPRGHFIGHRRGQIQNTGNYSNLITINIVIVVNFFLSFATD